MRKRLTIENYKNGILAGDRIILSQAITIIESGLTQDRKLASELLHEILPATGNSLRIGITGVPGVGKSTFIEALGKHITSLGKHLAVLTIDPSSKRSGGSILGDKTRMEQLSHDPLAYIRPSAANLSLGGVARNTRETILLCEAAGFEVIIVETVGVGQSETQVKGMTDFFLLLMLAGAGDELQGLKKGIMEMADAIAINKADGDNKTAAALAVQEYTNALHLFPKSESGFESKVVSCSALEQTGISDIWNIILAYQSSAKTSGFLYKNRQSQNLEWMYEFIRQTLEMSFYGKPLVKKALRTVEKSVVSGSELPVKAAQDLLDLFFREDILD
ncbi:methylmalonyl Co-A mutase-associated GTPase MeaB [Dyadobacter psychrotolerans]|uniref:Methylmalonyl Co-A mutase-associated GTPase MeaB n=1 Tax=Dyadobacter psychrotolerans TaxID=2541721 RepID=A0A4R5DGX6_9BACT|nr:methylmalonyl Co-A mutase-associated GTPase MeaB [Dyadobacter psychrotolerans]TDE09985.1 methylmalonyl Co-A mutase-associated GTPase MeaB [Dyadobacter psychrotolerans]